MMNERIKELAEQAKIQFTYDPTEKPIRAFAECWEDELEKFAELIVRECMGFCKEVESDMDGLPTKEMRDIGSMGAKFCYGQIKEHFGVEE
jgi:hypothetical protein